MSDSPVDVSSILRLGVYVLYHGGKVVFVGKSKWPIVQLAAHRSLARKSTPEWFPIRGIVFDAVTIHPCHPDRLLGVYNSLIELHQPRLNFPRAIPAANFAPDPPHPRRAP